MTAAKRYTLLLATNRIVKIDFALIQLVAVIFEERDLTFKKYTTDNAHLGFLSLGFQYVVKIFFPSAFLNDPSSETICILMLESILNKYTTKERV